MAYTIIIDSLGKVSQSHVLWQLVVEMDQLWVKPDNSTFWVLIRRLIAGGFTRQAIRAFENMGCFVEDNVGYFDFVLLLDMLYKEGYVKVATEVFNKKKFEFEVNKKVYTILIDGWWKINNGRWRRGFLGRWSRLGLSRML
ncbi:hypothetical protein AgCh_003883 [Apium graveolens]